MRIDDIEFLGAFCRVKLAVAGGEAPIVADFSINVMRDLGVELGQEMRVALPPQWLRVFPRAAQLP